MKNCWLDIDKEGLRKSLGQKDKVFLLTEMVSNAWDEDITKVEVTLSRPDENNQSWLRVIDNSPTGWGDLSHSHTMFAESTKKGRSEEDVVVPHGGKMKQLSPAAIETHHIIRTLRKYPAPQIPIAERKVLKNLSIQDYTDVVLAIEEPDAAQHNAQTRAQ